MFNKESQRIIDDIIENKSKYANPADKILFMTENIKIVPIEKIIFLEKSIDRPKIITEIASSLKDIEMAFKIEAGIFEFTLIYATTKDYVDVIMPSIYNDKVYDLLQNLNPKNQMQNKTLYKALQDGSINPQIIAFMRPQDLHPERWETLIKKKALREEKRKNMAVTDLYTCRKCGEKKCTVYESQTRALDEAITKFVTCTICYHVMKK